MATVYLAEDLKHRRKVAIKLLKPELAAAVGAERFLREIEISASLRHPHILPLYDSGGTGAFLYYVMPLVEGESLRDRLHREKQLPLEDALEIARQVADALDYAHARGVIHRDIKPENILLESGHAMVADFGIARAITAAGGERLTRTATTVGTPAYMSPEQAAGEKDLDGRSDQYALGCALYEMLAGQPPFTGPTVESLVRQHIIAEPPPVTQLRQMVPAGIAGVIRRSLAKNPADRFHTMAQFAAALKPDAAPGVVPRTTRWSRGMRLGLALASAGLAVAVWGLWRSQSRERPADFRTPPSLAVLPFASLSGGNDEYLGDGLAESLNQSLSRLPGLRVAARTSAFAFRGATLDVKEIGQRLGVTAVLAGSVQRSGNRIRVTAELADARTGFKLWDGKFDRAAADILEIEDEVARQIVEALLVHVPAAIGARLAMRSTQSPAAHEAYLLGLYYWNRRTRSDLQRAAEQFHRAIAQDSLYARAWAALALTYCLYFPRDYAVEGLAYAEIVTRVDQTARRAIALDPTLPEPYAALGQMYREQGRLTESEPFYRQALERDPRWPTAVQWYGVTLLELGRSGEAVDRLQEANRLDPLSRIITLEHATTLHAAGRPAEATQVYERGLRDFPDFPFMYQIAFGHFLLEGNRTRAASLLARWLLLEGGNATEAAELERLIRDNDTWAGALRSLLDGTAWRRFPDLGRIAAPFFARPDVRAWLVRGGEGDPAMLSYLERVMTGPERVITYPMWVMMALAPEYVHTPRGRAIVAAIRRPLGPPGG